jgi:hypothetical protein
MKRVREDFQAANIAPGAKKLAPTAKAEMLTLD